MRGWVYVIANPAMYGLVKIGFSSKDPLLRAKELGGTGIPHAHSVLYEVLVNDAWDVEQMAHKLLNDKREAKEWFRCSVDTAIETIKKSIGAGTIHLEKRYESLEARRPNPEEIFSGRVAMSIAEELYSNARILIKLSKEYPRADVIQILGEVDKKHMDYLQRASTLGDIEAKELLHDHYLTGFGELFPPDKIEEFRLAAEIIEYYLALAKAGDGHAIARLGAFYESGEYVSQDLEKALSFYMAAWKEEYSPVCICLYYFFRKQPEGLETAFEWLLRSALLDPDSGNTYTLAKCYANGTGTPVNPEAAAKWERKSKEISTPGMLKLLWKEEVKLSSVEVNLAGGGSKVPPAQ